MMRSKRPFFARLWAKYSSLISTRRRLRRARREYHNLVDKKDELDRLVHAARGRVLSLEKQLLDYYN